MKWLFIEQTAVFLALPALLISLLIFAISFQFKSEEAILDPPAPAYAGALLLKQTVGELTTEANRIIIADVVSLLSSFTPDNSNINTEVMLDVNKVLKGQASPQETLSLPGGTVGDVTRLVGGVPNFIAGERVLLFLDDGTEFAIAGMWQGKYNLSGDQAFQPETGQSVRVASLEQAISQALNYPVEIGSSPELVQAQFTTICPAWKTTQVPVPHHVNTANPGSGAASGSSFISAMYDALYAWQALPNSWVTLRIAGTTAVASSSFDGVNAIYWGNLSGGTLGINTCWFSGGTRNESDTVFDNSFRTWSMNAAAGTYDLPSTAEHEFGHGIGIGHSDQVCNGLATTPLMCPSVSTGVRKTILTDDSNAANFLNTLSGSPPNAPSDLSVAQSGTSNYLSWSDNSGDEHAFEIQRASGSCAGSFKGVATIPANISAYTDNDYGVGLSGDFCYRVKALNQGGDSAYSNAILNTGVEISKQAAIDPVVTGQPLTYTITITNTNGVTASNILITDIVPAMTTLNTSSLSGDATQSGTSPGSIITWTIGPSLTTGQSLTRSFVVTLAMGLANGATINNTAYVSASNISETNTSNIVVTTVAAPVLTATLSSDPSAIQVDTTVITYTITLQNTGDAAASNVIITNTVPSSTTFSWASDGGSEALAGTVVWPAAAVNANSSITRAFRVTVTTVITNDDLLTNMLSANTNEGAHIENALYAKKVGLTFSYLPVILKSSP